MSYPHVRIGEILELKYGKSLPSEIRSGAGYKVYGSNGMTGLHEIAITGSPAIIVGRKGSIGEIHYSEKPCWPIDTTYYVDSFGDSIAPRWLYHRLQNLNLKALNKAAAIPGLNRNDVYQLKIPLPPLEEQRRIAAILDKCYESELLATRASLLYSGLFAASFHSFLRQAEGLESIPMMPLSTVCTRITKGTTPSSLGLPDTGGDVPFVRVQDIDRDVLVAESVTLQIPIETHHVLSRSMLQTGDILVSIAGTIGRVCEVRGLPPHGANCNQAVAIARPIPDVVRPLFLKCLLSDRPAQKQMRGAVVTGTITNLSLSQLGEIKIPVPSIESQDRICSHLEQLAGIGNRFQNSCVTAKRLSDSIKSLLITRA